MKTITRHILADGREVKSVAGRIVPPIGSTVAAYRIAAEFAKNHPNIICQSKGEMTDKEWREQRGRSEHRE